MTFIEVTSSGKKFRRPGEDNWFGFNEQDGLMEFFVDGGKSFPCFTMHDFHRDDWEYVEEEVIEVGDVVRDKGGALERVVTWVNNDSGFIMASFLSDIPMRYHKDDLTLIRKGPKVHVFEGMLASHNMTTGRDELIFGGAISDIIENGKTYKMTLEEENDA